MTLILSLLFTAQAMPLTDGIVVDIPGPGRFDYMQVDNKYRRVMASHGPALSVYDLKTKKETEIETGGINGVQVSNKLGKIFVTGSGQKLIALDQKTLEKVGEVGFDGPGDDLVMDTKREKLYVCHDDGTEDWVIDAKTLKIEGSVKVDEAPEYVEYDAKTDRLYQNIKSTNKIQIIDPEKMAVVDTWMTEPEKGPHGLAIDYKTRMLFSAGSNGKLSVYNIDTAKLITTLDVKPSIDQIVFDPYTKRVYCAARGFISVVQETADGAVSLGDVVAPKGAHTITVDPKTHDVWVCYGDTTGAHFMSFHASK